MTRVICHEHCDRRAHFLRQRFHVPVFGNTLGSEGVTKMLGGPLQFGGLVQDSKTCAEGIGGHAESRGRLENPVGRRSGIRIDILPNQGTEDGPCGDRSLAGFEARPRGVDDLGQNQPDFSRDCEIASPQGQNFMKSEATLQHQLAAEENQRIRSDGGILGGDLGIGQHDDRFVTPIEGRQVVCGIRSIRIWRLIDSALECGREKTVE